MFNGKKFVQDPAVAEYYASDFLRDLLKAGEAEKKGTPSNNAARFASYYGVKEFPAELEQFVRMRDDHRLGYASLGEWRIWDEDVWLPDPAKGNLAEQIIKMDQGNYLGTCMLEYGAGCIFLGTAGNGDAYFASFNPDNIGGGAEIFYWNHETNDLEFPLADSLSSLAYANCLLAKSQGSEEDDEEEETQPFDVAGAFGRIKDRVRLSWHYNDLQEAAEADGVYKGSIHARYFFYRSLWINYLLRNDGVHTLNEVTRAFAIVDQGPIDLEAIVTGSQLPHYPLTAFYCLWRLFFFNKAGQLQRALDITKASANPVVRDMALLVEDLQNGRKQLGSIEDIHAVREAFLALDLDPDRAEERAREEAEAERQAEEQKAADEKRVAEMLATQSTAVLVDFAWENVGNQVVVEPIYERLRASEPGLAVDFLRADFYFNGGYNRNNRSYGAEADEILEALGSQGDPHLAPLLMNKGMTAMWSHSGHKLAAAVARLGDKRALAVFASWLDAHADYHHHLHSAATAAGAIRARDMTDALIAMIDTFAYAPDDFHARIKNKHLLWSLFEALAEIGDPRAVAPLGTIVASGHKDLAARAVASLGRLSSASAQDILLTALQGQFSRPAMFALARIGDERALEQMEARAARLRGSPARLAYERLMLDALRLRCGRAITLDNARFALKVVEASKYESVELHETAITLLANHLEGDERWAALAPFLDAEQERIRRVTRQALGALGKPAAVTFYDRATVDAIFAARGVEGLRAAFADPRGVLRHNLVRKAIDENAGAALETKLIAYGRDLLDFALYSYTYTRDKWEVKLDALRMICDLGSEAAVRLAYDASTQSNCMWREAPGAEARERAKRFGPMEAYRAAPIPGKALTLEPEPMGAARWSLGGMVNGMQFTADGERLIAAGGQGGAGGAAAIFDRSGVEIMALPAVRGWAYDVDIHPGGKIAAMGLHAGHLLLIDLATGAVLADLKGHSGVPSGVRKIRFSPDGTLLASASDDKSVIIWDVAARTMLRRVHDKSDVNTVDWFPDGKRVVFGTDRQAGIIDLADENAEIRRIDIGGVAEVRVFAGGTRIAAGGSTRKGIVILDEALEIVRTFDQRHVARIRFSSDESQMFAASWEGEKLMRRWDMASGEAIDLGGHDDAALFALDLDPQTGEPYAGGKKNVVASWRADGAPREASSDAHSAEVEAIVPGADGEIVSVARDGSVIRWSLESGAALAAYRLTTAEAGPMRCNAVAVSPDGAILLATGFDGAAAFRASDGEVLWRQTELQRSEIALGLDGAFVVGSGGALVWLDAATGSLLHTENVGDKDWLEHLLPLPDGHRAVVSAYRGPELHLLDLAARRRIASVRLPVHAEQRADSYGFGLGGGRLVVSRWDRSFDVFDAETLSHRLEAYEMLPYAPLAVSPGGSLVACGEDELRLFDAETFELVGRLSLGHKISALCFVEPGRVVAGLDNGQIVSVRISE